MLSRYRIGEKLGAGGMGIVYRAEDISLKRPVALKFLSGTSLSQEQTRARFLREAQTAASLNHPNVCTIYEVGEVQKGEEGALGSGLKLEASTPFIAMELIEGRTLEAIMRQSESLPLDDLLGIALQIADGMAAAHARGIVHRDLKPGNVMVTKEGRVKILDFGLAKPLEPTEPGDAAGTAAATASAELTREGRVIGTAAYMSPEQAKGEQVDSRSDIFSFGVMLYELATGTRPFRGTTTLSTLAKIIEAEPEPIPETRTDIPQELRRIVRRCLQKKPEDRYNDTRDLAAALKALRQETTSGAPKMVSGSAAAPMSRRRRVLWASAALVLVVVATAAIAWGLYHRGARKNPQESRQGSMKFTRVSGIAGLPLSPSLSPDGKFLAYVCSKDGKWGLSVRQLATGSDIRILSEHPTRLLDVTFSLNGERLYYRAPDAVKVATANLYQVPTLGGTSSKIVSDIDTPPAVSPDGRTIAFIRGDPTTREAALVLMQANGTGERKLAVRKDPDSFALIACAWSPDGAHVAALVQSSEGGWHLEVVEFGAEDGRESRLGTSRWGWVNKLAWLPDGSGLVLAGVQEGDGTRQVWLVSHPDGKVSRVTNDLNNYFDLSVAADGKTLATTRGQVAGIDLWSAPADDPNAAKQVTFDRASFEDAPANITSTPSGSIVFLTASSIWSMAPDGTGRRRLTPDGLECDRLFVARGAGTIVVTARRGEGGWAVWRLDLEGGDPTQLTEGKNEFVQAISPDGAWLIFRKEGATDLWKMRVDGGAPTKLEFPGRFDEAPTYSPDGKSLWVATWKGEAGSARLGLEEFPSDGSPSTRRIELPQVYFNGAVPSRNQWSRGGDAVAFLGWADAVLNIWEQPLAGSAARPLTRFKSGHVLSFDWSTDGKRLFMLRGEFTTDIVLITEFR